MLFSLPNLTCPLPPKKPKKEKRKRAKTGKKGRQKSQFSISNMFSARKVRYKELPCRTL